MKLDGKSITFRKTVKGPMNLQQEHVSIQDSGSNPFSVCLHRSHHF